ncbi:unnamed protein product [Lepeophtheirus salmonis]|uniref:(salmon louse) hypothetical protein n=1 Tax=Lepeophtheirus salmonis TaxID=72036 RepID=A0A7R8CBV1_LEPSM|nr:unnamed protein product [Lepeophtheirus salmonis]CAF2764406.1 unnamed protein product [Lepeophtheirus salmonis]
MTNQKAILQYDEDARILSTNENQVFFVQNFSSLTFTDILRIVSKFNGSSFEYTKQDSEEEVLNHEFTFWVEGVALTLISLFGIIGTSMSIRVLLKPDIRESFSGLLTGLAFCDVLFLIFSMCLFGLPKLWPWFGTRISNGLMPIGIGVVHIWRVGSTAITVSITIERYFAIVRPLKRFTYQRLLLVGSLLFAAIYNIPRFFEVKSVRMSTGEIALMASDLRNNPLYVQIYVFWSKFLLVELVPWFTIVILNTLILLTIMRSVQFRGAFVHSHGGQQQSQHLQPPQRRMRSFRQHTRVSIKNDFNRNETTTLIMENHRSRGSSMKIVIRKSKSLPSFQKIEDRAKTTTSFRRQRQQRRKSMPIAIERRLSRRQKFKSLHDIIPPKPTRCIMNPCHRLNSPPVISTSSTSMNLGKTLIGVSVLFLFCQSFKIIPDVYEGIWCNIRSKDPNAPLASCPTNTVIDILISLSNLLMCINSAMNFFMYMLRGSKFRQAFYNTYKLHRIQQLYYFICKKEPDFRRRQRSIGSDPTTTTLYLGSFRVNNSIRVNNIET